MLTQQIHESLLIVARKFRPHKVKADFEILKSQCNEKRLKDELHSQFDGEKSRK